MTNAHEYARRLFAQQCDFVLAAAEARHFPESELPEVAFIGRSNVGKSSLINALVGRKNLARASKTPGRTKEIIFFNLGNRLMLVDLPGYGHAKAPKAEKGKWEELALAYLLHRPNLKGICLLLDSSYAPKQNDLDMMAFLNRVAVPYKIVLTKADRANDCDTAIDAAILLAAKHAAALEGALAVSAKKAGGIDPLRCFLMSYAHPPTR